jgi:hypothetical protein
MQSTSEQSRRRPSVTGPFEDTVLRVLRGEISIKTAEEAVATPRVIQALTPADVAAIVEVAQTTASEGPWAGAVTLQRLLVASLRAADDSRETDALRLVAYRAWVEIARQALIVCPDARMLANARDAGEDVVRLEREAGSAGREAAGRFALGTLYVDPYTVGLPLAPGPTQDPDYVAWLLEQRVREQLGDELLSVPQAEWRMPPPREALRTADAYFAAASAGQTDEALARTLKAWAQTLAWRAAFGDDVRVEQITNMASRALTAAPADDPQLRLALVRFLQEYGIAPEAAELERLPDPDTLECRYGVGGAVEVVREGIQLLRAAGEFERAVTELDRALPLVSRARDADRAWALDTSLGLQVARAGVEEPGDGDDLRGALASMLAEYEPGDMYAGQLGWGLVAIARAAPRHDLELRGLDALRAALRLNPGLWTQHPDEIRWLQRVLQRGVAAQAALDENWGQALSAYIACACSDAELELYELARDSLTAVANVLEHPGVVPEQDALAALGTVAARLEVHAGEDAVDTIQEVWNVALDAHAPGAGWMYAGMLSFLVQMSKGLRFAMSLAAGTGGPAASEPADRELLGRIAVVEEEAATDREPGARPAPIDDEELLTAYARSQPAAEGASSGIRLSNLRQRFDERLAARLLTRTAALEETLLDIEDIQAALEPRTVLLVSHVGSAGGFHALRHLLLTRETAAGQVVQITSIGAGAMAVSEDAGPWLRLSPEAFLVQDVRRAVVAKPLGDEPVVPEAEGPLRRLHERLGDRVLARLDELRDQGKDHLCFATHGPLHYAPLHLVGPPGEPLADRWIVSYLPNLGLLRPPIPVRRRTLSIAALGLSYEGDPRGLEPMRDAVEEAELVAARFGGRALPEDRATERALRDALTTARFVHVSAHGEHDPAAPAFQCLYMMPGDGGDGRVFAHEVLDLDLRGLELLTLGACETALGRFDAADNLRGLPAAFLLAGVRRMVGTLWPVHPEASKRFFSELYGAIADEAGILDAFRVAQDKTRSQFPRYGDWGAFYLIAGLVTPHEDDE